MDAAAEAPLDNTLPPSAANGQKPAQSSGESEERDQHNNLQQAGEAPAAATGRKRTRHVRAPDEEEAPPAPRVTR